MRLVPVILISTIVATGCHHTTPASPSDDGGPPPTLDAGAGPDAASDRTVDQAGDRSSADMAPATTFSRPVEIISGSRLKGVLVQSKDGARHRWGMYDTMLSTRCYVVLADDGKSRCLPPPPTSTDLNINELVYTDAGCTEMALPEETACTAGFGFKETPAGLAVYRLGPASVRTMLFRKTITVTSGGTQTSCAQAPGIPTKKYFSLGEQLPATTFVEWLSSRTDGSSSQRIHGVYLQMADGAQIKLDTQLWDADLKKYCLPRLAGDGNLRCLPTGSATVSGVTFDDDKCTHGAAYVLGPAPMTPPTYAALETATSCSTSSRIFKVGAVLPAGGVFHMSAGQCVAFDPSTSPNVYYATGDEMEPTQFSPVRRVSLAHGRLEEQYIVNEEGAAAREFTDLWDTKLMQRCVFRDTASGRRCIPALSRQTFSDMNCTNAIGSPAFTACGLPPTGMLSLIGGPWCATQMTPVALGAPAALATPPQIFRLSETGACTMLSTSSQYQVIGDPLDLTMFEAGDEMMD